MDRREKEKKFKLLLLPDEPVGNNKETIDDLNEMFDIKFKKRINQLEVFHCIVRLIMLWDALTLPYSHHINKIFVASVGWISQMLSLFKLLFAKPQMMILDSISANDNNNSRMDDPTEKQSVYKNAKLIKSLSSVFHIDDFDKDVKIVG